MNDLEHVITAPPDDATIWHYFDLARYVGLLSRGLFFALPSALRRLDSWEGSWGEIDYLDSLDKTVHSGPDGIAEWRRTKRGRLARQDDFGVSCWHESPTESAALWQLYMPLGLGVAVKSTPARIREALRERTVEIRRIDYQGHQGKLGDAPLDLLSTKRPEFQHEVETRLFVALTPDEKTLQQSFYRKLEDHGKYRRITPGQKGIVIEPRGGWSTQDPSCLHRGAPAGTHLPTDLKILVDGVYLGPSCAYPLRRAVADVTERFGLDKSLIKESRLDRAPPDQVQFAERDDTGQTSRPPRGPRKENL